MAKQNVTKAQQTLPAAAPAAAKLTATQKKAIRAAIKTEAKAAWANMTTAERKAVRAAVKARTAAKAPKLLLERLAKARKTLGQACALVASVSKDDGDGYPAVQVLIQASDAAKDAQEQIAALVTDGWAPPAAPKQARLGKSIEAGATVCVRAKRRADFEGILEDAEMDALKVVKIVKNVVFVHTASGDRLMIPRGKVQLAPAA